MTYNLIQKNSYGCTSGAIVTEFVVGTFKTRAAAEKKANKCREMERNLVLTIREIAA